MVLYVSTFTKEVLKFDKTCPSNFLVHFKAKRSRHIPKNRLQSQNKFTARYNDSNK